MLIVPGHPSGDRVVRFLRTPWYQQEAADKCQDCSRHFSGVQVASEGVELGPWRSQEVTRSLGKVIWKIPGHPSGDRVVPGHPSGDRVVRFLRTPWY